MPKIEVRLTLTRATKRTYRFDADEGGYITSLYVQKTAFPLGPPEAITVTVEADVRVEAQ